MPIRFASVKVASQGLFAKLLINQSSEGSCLSRAFYTSFGEATLSYLDIFRNSQFLNRRAQVINYQNRLILMIVQSLNPRSGCPDQLML